MKLSALTFIFFIQLFNTSLYSQCPTGYYNYHFGTQSSIDVWDTYWSDCSYIDDDLKIEGTWSSGSDIIDLYAFRNLTSVTGDLTIQYNHQLTSLMGLNNLTSVGGNLTINLNVNLINLVGLSNLNYVGGNIFLYANHELNNIDGIAQLNSIPGDFEIYFNNKLIEFPAFKNLKSIGGKMRIENNALLKNLHGFDSLAYIGGDLEILDNYKMDSLFNSSTLSEINGYLLIDVNLDLLILSGLDSLKNINGFLKIEYNPKLTNISGIRNIDPNSIVNQSYWQLNDFTLTDNIVLSDCAIQSICDYLHLTGKTTFIEGNGTGCNTEMEILNNCVPAGIMQDPIFSESTIIYPNPTDKVFTLEFSQNEYKDVLIQLISLSGKLMKEYEHKLVSNKSKFSIEDLEPGTYIINIRTCDKTIQKLIIIEK